MSIVCFFFQSEDGIRGAQESRGLGDLYKRQVLEWPLAVPLSLFLCSISHDCTLGLSLTSSAYMPGILLAGGF